MKPRNTLAGAAERRYVDQVYSDHYRNSVAGGYT
jgi:hypothetical protein